MAESEDELKNLLMKAKEESEKAGLKLNIQKTMIMASSLITTWQIGGEKMEAVTDFIFLVCVITVDGDWGHEKPLPSWDCLYTKCSDWPLPKLFVLLASEDPNTC